MAEVTPHDREQALAELERIAYTLTQMSQWLGSAGEQRSAVMLEEAWKNVVAAGWLIQRQPARAAVPAYHRPPAALEGPKHRRGRPAWMAPDVAADTTLARSAPVRRALRPG